MNPIRGQNTEQMVSMNDVVDYTYNVTQPQQQIDSNNVSSFNRNSSSFHRSIGNNVITTDNQNNVNGGYIHNVIHPQQQVDFNDISPPQMRPVYNNYRNTKSSNENIENNLMTTQVTSMIDNQVSHQNKVEDTKDVQNNFPQRQIPERETIPYCDKNTNSLQNDTLTHDVPMTDINFDHRDTYHFYTPVEGITAQAIPITDVNQNYDDNDVSYNDNHDQILRKFKSAYNNMIVDVLIFMNITTSLYGEDVSNGLDNFKIKLHSQIIGARLDYFSFCFTK
uniref:Uncharacterized protein n=1 Tax=Rhizophagus irregularis (strain DAOM 181602 / DAOM 197198 / MUCL 43194) TaxID=747089 RepID=U9UJB0_RHIID